MDFATGFNGVRSAPKVMCTAEEDKTVQSGKEDADINVIVKRFGITGELPVLMRSPLPDGFYENLDFRAAMDIVHNGQQSFEDQPASVRERFGHDPAKFLEFFGKEENFDEAVKLGLIVKRELPPKAASLDDVVAAVKSLAPAKPA